MYKYDCISMAFTMFLKYTECCFNVKWWFYRRQLVSCLLHGLHFALYIILLQFQSLRGSFAGPIFIRLLNHFIL